MWQVSCGTQGYNMPWSPEPRAPRLSPVWVESASCRGAAIAVGVWWAGLAATSGDTLTCGAGPQGWELL